MSTFVLIPGAGGAAWYWHRVLPELRARGHEAFAVDLPGADERRTAFPRPTSPSASPAQSISGRT